MKVLINALGISDSGGVTVFDKLLNEIKTSKPDKYYIICNKNRNIDKMIDRHQEHSNLKFFFVSGRGVVFRIVYENFLFGGLIRHNKIDLIYNFSGTGQPLLNTPQITKVQNLLFFSKELDLVYFQKKMFIPWIREVFIKRIFMKVFLRRVKHIEIQSAHVVDNLSDYFDTSGKSFYIKSDVQVFDDLFTNPKKYNMSNKVYFLYIVGPHFELTHKDFDTFVQAMLKLKREGVDYEIRITLTYDQLNTSQLWNSELNARTDFVGYIDNQQKMKKMFCDNTILISTSIIETLGLHVIEAIQNGIAIIVPNEEYSEKVYGKNAIKYTTLSGESLASSILDAMKGNKFSDRYVLLLQRDLRVNEKSKLSSILDVFKRVVDV